MAEEQEVVNEGQDVSRDGSVNGNTKDVKIFPNSSDPSFLAVKGNIENRDDARVYVKNLAQAIYVVFTKHKTVQLRCVGAASVSNAVKAVAIATADLARRDVLLVSGFSFTTVRFDNNEERSAIILTVREETNLRTVNNADFLDEVDRRFDTNAFSDDEVKRIMGE